MKRKFKKFALSEADKARILDGSLLNDAHIDYFHHLLRNNSQYDPQSTLLIQNVVKNPMSTCIRSNPRHMHYLQILHSCDDYCERCVNGHWVCCHYDANAIYIYDSLNNMKLHNTNVIYLKKLFPYFDEIPKYFPTVQKQINGWDCGVFAIAFATSIVLKRKPSLIIYDCNKLRSHLFQMFQTDTLKHFPTTEGQYSHIDHNYVKLTKPDHMKSVITSVGVKNCVLKNVKDNKIKINRIDTNVEGTSNRRDDSSSYKVDYHVVGLRNSDHVSCFANASLQSLIHCSAIRSNMLMNFQMNHLNVTFHDYVYKGNIDVLKLRLFAHEQYVNNEQQDVAEFITHLCEKSRQLQTILSHTLVTQIMCTNCKKTNYLRPYNNQILLLTLPKCRSNLTLQTIINYNYGSWNSTDIGCNDCKSTKVQKTEITSAQDIIILQLQLFVINEYDYTISKLTDVSLKNIQNEVVTINFKSYRMISAIFHDGDSIYSGHYTNFLRVDNDWLRIDDSLVKKHLWPTNSKDIYLIFLERTGDTISSASETESSNTMALVNSVNKFSKSHIIHDMTKEKYELIEEGNRKRKHEKNLIVSCDRGSTEMFTTSIVNDDIDKSKVHEDVILNNNISIIDKKEDNIKIVSKRKTDNYIMNVHKNESNLDDYESNNLTTFAPVILTKSINSNQTNRKYYQRKREEILKKRKSRYESNKSIILDIRKGYYDANRSTILKRNKAYYDANRSIISKRRKLYCESSSVSGNMITTNGEILSNINDDPVVSTLSSSSIATSIGKTENTKNLLELKKDEIAKRNKSYYNSHRNSLLNSRKMKYQLNKNSKLLSDKYFDNVNENNVINTKKKLATKIKQKYKNISMNLNTIKLLQNKERYVKCLMEKLDHLSMIERRMEAEMLISTSIYIRNNYISKLKSKIKNIKEKIEISLTRLGDKPISGNEEYAIAALCGISRHCSSTEAFFSEATYEFYNVPPVNSVIINEQGHSVNILPLLETSGKNMKVWECNSYCKTFDVDILRELQFLFQDILDLTHINAYNFFKSIESCSFETRDSKKLGHSPICYAQPLLCSSRLLKLIILSYHHPHLRTIKRLIHEVQHLYSSIHSIENALNNYDVVELKKLSLNADRFAMPRRHENSDICLDELELKRKYHIGIKEYMRIDSDPPTISCISCERLCCKRSVDCVNKLFSKSDLMKMLLDINIDNNYCEKLKQYYGSQNIDDESICFTCSRALKRNLLPSLCILNNLFVKDIPDEILVLNFFEKILIQRAKAFQTIIKMNAVMKKNLPHYVKIDKVKGRTFHLPLPLEETLRKICPESDPLNTNHELFIMVRSIPTKGKIIWENYVDVKKIWRALNWLKCWNPLYAEVIIPCTPYDLLEILDNLELQYKDSDETENADGDDKNNDSSKQNINVCGNVNKDVTKALLTQKNQSDSYYEQYSVYPLYAKKLNNTDTNLYQMLQIYASALDFRGKNLDLKCFPDLYPFGVCGQHEDRYVKLRDFDFIKSRLMSKHSRFRLNIQYLFYLLHDNNIRQISGGIFHKMNVVDPKYRFTAGEFRQNLEKNQLESNMETIFSRLRGTEAYWRKPRNDLDCMMNEYGPTTFFVTLSPGEWMWASLGEYIREINSWECDKRSISELIAIDPVSASRYIHNRFQAILTYILSSANPIGKVDHFYYACEYQGRGLPHFHCLFWIKDAPIYGKSTNEEVQNFILKNITCRIPDKYVSPELERRVNMYQRHKHNNYCMRKKKTRTGFKSSCRFAFPRPVTSQLILRSVSVAISNRRNLKNKSRFYDLPRKQEEIFINDYMPALLILWEGNNDAQFICESSYLLTKYVSSYGTKGEKSVVDFTDIQLNKSLCSRLWSFSLRALNHRECGAIEAADALLGHPLHATDSDTLIRWLDVRSIRSRKLKSYSEIKNLAPDSTDIFCDSLIDTHYCNRPQQLQSMCLYDFAKWFDMTKKKPVRKVEYYEMSSGLFCKKRKKPYIINHWKYNPINQPEKYYYSLLLLFKPWNDVEELKGNEDSYTNSFYKEQDKLIEALKYHDKCEVIREAMDKMNDMIQNQMMLDEQKDNQLQSDNAPEGCVPLETENAMRDFKDIANKVVMSENDIKVCISKFNEDQSRVFKKITSAMENSDKTLRMFISGPGGTGKSFIIETLVSWNKAIRGKDTAITAPTGLAAYNIHGLTVHRLLQLPVEQGCTAKYKELSSAALKEVRLSLRNVDLIIIDEISMISNVLLMYIHLRLTEIFDSSDCDDGWFGKNHVIVFGDLLQLPPVDEDFPFIQMTNQQIDKYVGGMHAFNLWSLFEYDELTINMRQKDDEVYSSILSRLRLGIPMNEDISVLQQRKLKFSMKDDNYVDDSKIMNELCEHLEKLPHNAVCLLPTRKMCDVLNTAMLSRINSEEIDLVSSDSFKCPKNLEKKIMNILRDNDDRNCGVERVIKVKINSKIMIRRNIDVTLGLVNGTIATVISVQKDKNNEINELRILLQNGKEHSLPRLEYKFIILDKIYILRKQFPICNSYGITIHKSQGLSLEAALVEAGNSIFSCGQTYVALSRVTTLEGLYLINFDPSSVMAHKSAILEYNRLRRMYRPDLLPLNINDECQASRRYHKVPDVYWAVRRYTTSIGDDNSLLNCISESDILGLPNNDQVSCYANACIQCLFQSTVIRKVLLRQRDSDILKVIFNQYISKSIVDIKSLREYVDVKYKYHLQQDASEFLTDMCNRLPFLQDILQHQLITVIRCPGCDDRMTSSNSSYILPLYLPETTHPYCFQDIIDYNLGNWQEIDGYCDNGCKVRRLQRIDVQLSNTIVIVQLVIFTNCNGNISKVNLKMNNIPNKVFLINKIRFKVVSGIFHHGQSLEFGHYTSILRMINQWISVSDNHIKKIKWPRGAKDAYLLFLERI